MLTRKTYFLFCAKENICKKDWKYKKNIYICSAI